MHIVVEHVRPNRPNLTEIHCRREESLLVAHALQHLTGKLHLPIDVLGEEHVFYITDRLSLEEAEALLIGIRHWKFKPEQFTYDRLRSISHLEKYMARLASRQGIHNLEADLGLDAFDFACEGVAEG